jgi:hypothetical protein
MGINDRIKKHNAKATGWNGPAAQPSPATAVATPSRKVPTWLAPVGAGLAVLFLIGALSAPDTQHKHPAKAKVGHKAAVHKPKLKLTASEQLALQGVDAGMGKALQAAMSSDGLYEGRTSAEWCSLAGEALNTVLFPNSGSFEHQNTPTKRGERLTRENGTIKSFYENCM